MKRLRFFIRNSSFEILHSLLLLVISAPLLANDLSVDKRSVRVDEPVAIVVSLEDAFAEVDSVTVPVQNMEIDRPPSVSSEFSWINGTVVRRKVFRFTAHAIRPGAALVGPLRIDGAGGQRQTLPAVLLQVVADVAATSNDPAAILRELSATGRDPFFVVAEADRTSAYAGEEVIVTWTLYNGASVQQWQIGRVPKLDDFWTEELDVRNEQPSRALVDGVVLQTLPIRRVALFPLRSGTLHIGSMEIAGAVMRRIDAGPFGLFEGSLVEVRFPSSEVTIDAKPLPPGPPVDAVGDFVLSCAPPLQKGGGPVVVEATLSGRGNLRSAVAPRFEREPDAGVQVADAGLTVDRTRGVATMRRRWKYLLFPRKTGTMTIPPLMTQTFAPSTAERQTLRCSSASINVQAATPAREPQAARVTAPLNQRHWSAWLLAAAVLASVAAVSLLLLRRRRSVAARARALVGQRSPSEIRTAVHDLLAKRSVDPDELLREPTERGDVYRAFRSITDAVETDRIDEGSGRALLTERVGELLEVIG